MMPSEALAHHTYRSRSLKPPSPLLHISSAFALSSFTAATALSSIALASSAVPKSAAQTEAAVESTGNTTKPTTNAILRNMTNLPGAGKCAPGTAVDLCGGDRPNGCLRLLGLAPSQHAHGDNLGAIVHHASRPSTVNDRGRRSPVHNPRRIPSTVSHSQWSDTD